MQGVRKQNRFEGDVEIRALLAGVDILLLPNTRSLPRGRRNRHGANGAASMGI